MQFRQLVSITLGRLLMPLRAAAPAGPNPGEHWVMGDQLFTRNADGDQTLRHVTDADFNVPGGVPQLGADGKIPASLIAASSTGGTGGGAQSTIIGKAIGEVWASFCDPGAPPAGALICDGAEYLRTDYPTLFSVIKTRAGRPSSDLYFRVPDCRQRVIYGSLGGSAVRKGAVYKVSVTNRGSGLTPGSYDFTFEGGTYATPALGKLVVTTENVPGIGSTGVVSRIEIRDPGSYTTFGAPASGSPSNTAVKIPEATLPASAGALYEVFGRPVDQRIRGINVTAHGTGYTTAPLVAISGGALLGATAYAIIDAGGRVAHVVITNPGMGDPTGAVVAITGGGGAGATAVLDLASPFVITGDLIGASDHTLTTEEMPSHTHSMAVESGGGLDLASPTNTAGADEQATGNLTGATGGGLAHALLPPGVGATILIQAL